jgi:hypothetical protein
VREIFPFYNQGILAFHIIYIHRKSEEDGRRIISNLPDEVLSDTRKKWLLMLESGNPFFKANRRQTIHLFGNALLANPRAKLLFYNIAMLEDNKMSKDYLNKLFKLSTYKWITRNQHYSWSVNQIKFYSISKEFILTRLYYPDDFKKVVLSSSRAAFESVLSNTKLQEDYLSLYDQSTNMFYVSENSGLTMHILCEGFSPKMIVIK